MMSELDTFAEPLRECAALSLAERTLQWCDNVGVFNPSEGKKHSADELKLVVLAAVFAACAGPPAPSSRALDLVARFTTMFLYIDDSDTYDLSKGIDSGESWNIGRLTPAMRQFLQEWEEFRAAPPDLRQAFTESYHEYLHVRMVEQKTSSGDLSLDECWRLRRVAIFVEPHINGWLINTGQDTSRIDMNAWTQCRSMVTDVAVLANDLGSVVRDGQSSGKSGDMNVVYAMAQEYHLSMSAGIEHAIGLYNRKIDELARALDEAVSREGCEEAEVFAATLRGIVDGNLRATKILGFRYPGVTAMLKRLARLEGRGLDG